MVRISFVILVSTLLTSCENNNTLKESKKFDTYPSASGIEYFNKRFYIVGDDANNVLILDSNLIAIDSIGLYHFTEKRIPKSVKSDMEAMTVTEDKQLLMVGSGSVDPYRNMAWLIDPVTKKKDSIHLDVFYSRLKLNNIAGLNIEGIASIPGFLLLSNRGNKGYPKNQLIVTSASFWNRQERAPINIVSIGGNTDSNSFKGVSGLAYAKKSDKLVMTVSTEDTRNATEDGAIGKSYIWIIDNISSKRNWNAANPDKIIDLGKIDPKFVGQKIESVCIVKETKNFLHLVLAADNDDGSSSIFKVIIEKN